MMLQKHTRPPLKLVLLPGMDGTGRLFAPFLASAPSGFELQSISYPNELAGIEALATYVLETLDSRPCFLLAESYSGAVALAMIRRQPEQFQGLILCATFIESPRPVMLKLAQMLPMALLRYLGSRDFIARLACLSFDASTELFTLFRDVIAQLPTETLKRRLTTLQELKASSEDLPVSIPIAYLKAMQDRLVPTRAGTKIQKNITLTDCFEIQGPHFLLQCRPEQCWQAIYTFLAKHPSV